MDKFIIFALVAGVMVVPFLKQVKQKGEYKSHLDNMCGLATGVPEADFVDNELYCRTKHGDLVKPNSLNFQLETIKSNGTTTYNYVPRRRCKK